jgi:uncharacterized membrane protein
MTLAFVMALDRGYLTVAFAITALTTARYAIVDRIPLLRYVVVALGFIVLGRLAWDPLSKCLVKTSRKIRWIFRRHSQPS